MQNTKEIKSQNYTITLYTENESDMLKLEYIKLNYKYAYILHNMDTWTNEDYQNYVEQNGKEPNWKAGEKKKEHIHIIIYLNSQKALKTLAKELNIETNRIEQVKDIRKMTRYLTHIDFTEKFQYDIRDIFTNNYEKIIKYFKNSSTEQEDVKRIYEYIYSIDRFIYQSDVLDFVIFNNLYASYRRGISIFKELIKEHNKLYLERKNNINEIRKEEEKEIWEYEKQVTKNKAKR